MVKRNNRSNKKDEQSTKTEKTNKKEEGYILGLDISTSVIGLAILEPTTGALVQLEYLKLTSNKYDNIWSKADCVSSYFSILNDNLNKRITKIYVEESAKRFSPGFSSANTLFTLAKFNGIVSYIARSIFHAEVIDINVNSARSKLGIKIDRKDKTMPTKEKVFQYILAAHPYFPWITHVAKNGKHKDELVYDQCNRDMCDAFVIASAGRLL